MLLANLSEARLFYHFSVRSFVRGIFEFRDLNRNPSLYVVPVSSDSRSFFTQLLFSYKLNPQTVDFLGYQSPLPRWRLRVKLARRATAWSTTMSTSEVGAWKLLAIIENTNRSPSSDWT